VPSIIKVDQIQSDTGNVAFTGNIAFSSGSASSPSITTVGDTNTGIFFPSADTIALTEGGTEVLRIDSNATVAIGATNALGLYDAKLAVNGNVIVDFDKTIGFQWTGQLNGYHKGMSGRLQSSGLARGLHLFNYDADASQGIRFWGGTFSSRSQLGAFENDGNFQFNSGYGSVATAYGCRAWVNFNGTGTVAIRGSGNVSSITDNGVGIYTVNFTNNMPDVNYATVVDGQHSTSAIFRITPFGTYAEGGVQVDSTNADQTARVDVAIFCVSVFR